MNKIILLIGAVLIGLNILFGLMLSSYQSFNLMLTSLVLLYSTGAMLLSNRLIDKNAFIISLTCLFSATGVIKFIIGIFSPDKIMDNWGLITIIVLSVIEFIVLMIVKYVSGANSQVNK